MILTTALTLILTAQISDEPTEIVTASIQLEAQLHKEAPEVLASADSALERTEAKIKIMKDSLDMLRGKLKEQGESIYSKKYGLLSSSEKYLNKLISAYNHDQITYYQLTTELNFYSAVMKLSLSGPYQKKLIAMRLALLEAYKKIVHEKYADILSSANDPLLLLAELAYQRFNEDIGVKFHVRKELTENQKFITLNGSRIVIGLMAHVDPSYLFTSIMINSPNLRPAILDSYDAYVQSKFPPRVAEEKAIIPINVLNFASWYLKNLEHPLNEILDLEEQNSAGDKEFLTFSNFKYQIKESYEPKLKRWIDRQNTNQDQISQRDRIDLQLRFEEKAKALHALNYELSNLTNLTSFQTADISAFRESLKGIPQNPNESWTVEGPFADLIKEYLEAKAEAPAKNVLDGLPILESFERQLEEAPKVTRFINAITNLYTAIYDRWAKETAEIEAEMKRIDKRIEQLQEIKKKLEK